jgi:hypothetical protein
VIAINNCTLPQELFGDLRQANETLDVAIAFCTSRGMLPQKHWLTGNFVAGLYELGEWDRALERAVHVAEARDAPRRAQELVLPWIARIHAARGDVAAAESANARALGFAREQQDGLRFALVAAALVAAAAGDRSLANAYLEEADETPEPPELTLDFLTAFARASAFAGRLMPVRKLLDVADPSVPYYARHASTAEAILREADDEWALAAQLYEGVAVDWRENGYLVEHAHALVGFARCRIALGRGADATAPIADARRAFERLSARTFIAETDELLAKVAPVSMRN